MPRTKKLKKVEDTVRVKNSREAVDVIAQKEGEDWQAKTLEVESNTHLEADEGVGDAVTLRFFTYRANPERFQKELPSEQTLFNNHLKEIEYQLWLDGWKPYPEVNPRLQWSVDGLNFESFQPLGKQYNYYRFIIAAIQARGNFLSYTEKPLTLSQIATNGRKQNPV